MRENEEGAVDLMSFPKDNPFKSPIEQMTTRFKIPSKEDLYKTGFWFVIIFLIGFLIGMWYAEKKIIVPKLMEAKRIGALVIGEDVYDLKERK